MATQTFYRKANVSSSEATTSLFKSFPNAELVSFETKAATAEEAASAGVTEGELVYAATVRTAEFPPADGAGEDKPEAPKDDAPAEGPPAPDSDGGDAPEEKDDSSSDDGGNPFGGGDDEGGEEGGKPKELKGEELTNHLLKQLLDAVKGGSPLGPDAAGPDGPGGPGGPGAPGDLDLPDIGAPDQGEGLPAPGGPAGPGGPKPPLPPPIKEKAGLGAGAFAHVAGAASIHMVRADAGEVNNAAILKEAAEYAPTHKVERIQRSGTAVINGQTVNVAEKKIAVVTLVQK